MKMTIDGTPRENIHGVYGYAYGTSKVDGNCVFAWQVIRNVTRADLADVKSWLQPKYSAKLRVRYCHPTKSISTLVTLLDGLQVKPVVSSTMEMLRFAEGAGYVPASGTLQQIPVLPPKAAPKVVRKKVKARKAIIRKPVKIVSVKKEQIIADPNAIRIKLPSEFGAEDVAKNTTISMPEIEKSTEPLLVIPLPEDVKTVGSIK